MRIQSGEYKTRVGLDNLYYAVVSADSAAAYTVGSPTYLAPAAAATQAPSTNIETQYADDQPYDVITSEGATEIVLTVTDQAGQVVRRITGPTGKGLHRVAWDLRYPAVDPTQLEERQRESWEYPPQGPLVVPGSFTVALAKKVDGVLTPLGSPKTFTVESLNLATLTEKDKSALLAYQKKAGELQRAMMGAAAAAEEALGILPLNYARQLRSR